MNDYLVRLDTVSFCTYIVLSSRLTYIWVLIAHTLTEVLMMEILAMKIVEFSYAQLSILFIGSLVCKRRLLVCEHNAIGSVRVLSLQRCPDLSLECFLVTYQYVR